MALRPIIFTVLCHPDEVVFSAMQPVPKSGRDHVYSYSTWKKKRKWVELRCLHRILRAPEGVRTRDASGTNVPEECARHELIRELIRELSVLLRQRGLRVCWLAPVQAGIDPIPGSQPAPAPIGNSANVAVVVQLRVSSYLAMLCPSTDEY